MQHGRISCHCSKDVDTLLLQIAKLLSKVGTRRCIRKGCRQKFAEVREAKVALIIFGFNPATNQCHHVAVELLKVHLPASIKWNILKLLHDCAAGMPGRRNAGTSSSGLRPGWSRGWHWAGAAGQKCRASKLQLAMGQVIKKRLQRSTHATASDWPQLVHSE